MKAKYTEKRSLTHVLAIAILTVVSCIYCSAGSVTCYQTANNEPAQGESSCADDNIECTSWALADPQLYCEDLAVVPENRCKYCGEEFELPTTKSIWNGTCVYDSELGEMRCDTPAEPASTPPETVWSVPSGTSCELCTGPIASNQKSDGFFESALIAMAAIQVIILRGALSKKKHKPENKI
jgi:hypothetical protein